VYEEALPGGCLRRDDPRLAAADLHQVVGPRAAPHPAGPGFQDAAVGGGWGQGGLGHDHLAVSGTVSRMGEAALPCPWRGVVGRAGSVGGPFVWLFGIEVGGRVLYPARPAASSPWNWCQLAWYSRRFWLMRPGLTPNLRARSRVRSFMAMSLMIRRS